MPRPARRVLPYALAAFAHVGKGGIVYSQEQNSYHRDVREPSAKRDASLGELAFVKFDPHHVLGTWRNVVIAIWVDETSLAVVEEAEATVRRLSARYPEGIAVLQIFGEEHPSIEPPVRAALKELLRAGRDVIREAPVVYEGQGFRAASIRAIVTGLLPQRSLGFPHRVYSSVEEAARAVAQPFEKREPTRFARELCEALAAIRDRHRSEFPSAPRSFIRYRSE